MKQSLDSVSSAVVLGDSDRRKCENRRGGGGVGSAMVLMKSDTPVWNIPGNMPSYLHD